VIPDFAALNPATLLAYFVQADIEIRRGGLTTAPLAFVAEASGFTRSAVGGGPVLTSFHAGLESSGVRPCKFRPQALLVGAPDCCRLVDWIDLLNSVGSAGRVANEGAE